MNIADRNKNSKYLKDKINKLATHDDVLADSNILIM
jgi:hypothetical protein